MAHELKCIAFRKETTIININILERKRRILQRHIGNNTGSNIMGNLIPIGDPYNMILNLLQFSNPWAANRYFDMYMTVNQGTMEDVPTPLDSKKMSKLVRKKYSEIENISDDCCAICQSKYDNDDELTILPCDGHHHYHTDCIGEWLSKFSKKCPSCRQNLDEINIV